MTRAAIYLRVSTAGQEDNTSLATQEAGCKRYCAERGYEVIGVWSDVHTGSQLSERPKLSELREAVLHGKVEVVVAYALDRLSRDQNHIGILLDEWKRHAVSMEFATERFEDTPVGRFLIGAQAFAAELERVKIAERTKRGLQARYAAGLRHPGSKPTYGYRYGDERKGTLVVNEVEASVVRFVYASLLSGQSLRSIARILTDRGTPTPKGRTTFWRDSTIRVMVSHPHYKGDGAPQIVDEDTWSAAQVQLDVNRATRVGNTRKWSVDSSLLRSGHVFCGYCGNAMVIMPVTRTDHIDLYYYCATRRKGDPRCPGNRYAPVQEVDSIVWDWLLRECVTLQALFCKEQHQPNLWQEQLVSIDNEIARLRARGKALREAILGAPAILVDDYRADEAAVALRLETLTRERERASQGQTVARREAEEAKSALATLTSPDCTYEQKRRVLMRWEVKAHIDRDDTHVTRKGSGCSHDHNTRDY